MKLKNILIPIYFIVLACDVYAVFSDNKSLEMLFKPLLMPILVGYYLLSVKQPSFWFVSALFFSFWGDVLLLFEEQFFVFGLASFLVAHLLYIKLTSLYFKRKETVLGFAKASIPFVVFFSIIIFLTQKNLNEMLIPVLVYGFVIAVFGTFTRVNYQQNKGKASLLLLLGASVFIVSDAFIALNKFHQSHKAYEILIITLYCFAQFLIFKALICKGEDS